MADYDKLVENLFYKKEKVLSEKHLFEFIFEQYEQKKIDEGRGMPFRKEGDKFVNLKKPEEILIFEKAFLFPPEGGSYQDKNETEKEVNNFIEKNNLLFDKPINSINTSAILVVLKNLKNPDERYAFVKYFRFIKPDGRDSWTESGFGNDTGYVRYEESGKISSSASEKMLLKPSDLIGDGELRTLSNLKELILQKTTSLVNNKLLPQITLEHVNSLLEAAINNQPSPELKGAAKYSNTYNKYLGEILAPFSLLTGWLSQGDRAASEKALLNAGSETITRKYSPATMLAGFNTLKNERTKDSVVVDEASKIEIGISSKAEEGAAGSLDNLNDTLDKAAQKNKEVLSFFKKKYAMADAILELNRKSTSLTAPIEIAKLLKIINPKDVKFLKLITRDKATSMMNVAQFKQNYSALITPKILELMQEYGGKSDSLGYLPVNHIITAVAKECARVINESEEIKFSEAVKTILVNSSLVQINSKIKVSGDNFSFTGFDVKYPPQFPGKILITIKSYSASVISGKFTFKIPNK